MNPHFVAERSNPCGQVVRSVDGADGRGGWEATGDVLRLSMQTAIYGHCCCGAGGRGVKSAARITEVLIIARLSGDGC